MNWVSFIPISSMYSRAILAINSSVSNALSSGLKLNAMCPTGCFIFGLSSQEVINYENNGGYNPVDIYFNDWEIKRVVDQLMDGTYSNGDHNMYINLYSSLLNTQCTDRADTYFILKDFRSYADAQKRVEEAYRDQQKWSKMAMLNTACSGKFTSDRTIEEYVRDIWHLEKVEVPSGQDLFD